MKKKEIVDLVVAVGLIIVGSLILTFPLLKIVSVRYIFIAVLVSYGVLNLIQYILTSKDKDYEGLFTMIGSIVSLLLLGLLDIENTPGNLALVLFVWIIMMSLIKLKKCDYYHDRHKRIYILKIVTLILFILVGLLATINLYYEPEVQILVLGFFYFIHGVLELVDPITNYLIRTNNVK